MSPTDPPDAGPRAYTVRQPRQHVDRHRPEHERWAKAIRDVEREACAKVAEDACDELDDESQEFFVAANIMSAIRVRSNPST